MTMKKTLAAALVSLFAVSLAYAGSRAKETTGNPPTLATDGVNLAEVEGCRISVRSTDGGTINGGTLRQWYYDSVLGWVPSNSSLDCSLDSARLLDAGAPSGQVCPDVIPLAKFGRMSVEANAVRNFDAGTVPGITTRVECWGRNIP